VLKSEGKAGARSDGCSIVATVVVDVTVPEEDALDEEEDQSVVT
jgi:hypothetical protein